MAHAVTQQSYHSPPVVEILAKTSEATDRFDLANRGFKAVAGMRAFRRYDWISGVRGTNIAGGFRGMVVSARWRTVFHFSSDVIGKYIEGIGTLSSVAADILNSGSQFESIWKSQETPALKGMRFASLAGTMANHALLGIVPAGASVIYFSLQGYCQAMGMLGGNFRSASDSCIRTLQRADAYVQTGYQFLTDNRNVSNGNYSNANQTLLVNVRFLTRH